MAQSFSLKKYVSKLHAHSLLAELAAKHEAQILFDINDQTPRKLAIQMMEDALKSTDTEARLAIMRDLSFVSSMTSAHASLLAKKLFRKETGKEFEPEIECASDADTILYVYLRHPDIADKLSFLHPFYASKSYTIYEAKPVDYAQAELKLTELSREFTRLANKDDNATEQHMEHLLLDDVLYVSSTFHDGYDIGKKIDEEGENRKHVTRKIQSVRIAYLPKEEVVLIAGTVSKAALLIFLDTFLRVVTGGGYEAKVESYDLVPLKNLSLDFTHYTKGTPFIKAVVKSITVSYAEGKKKLRIALPSSREHSNMQHLEETLNELDLVKHFETFAIAHIALGFMFQNKDQQEKSVSVSCSLQGTRSSLCPLFEYERYAKSILKNAGIYEGFKAP